MVPPRPRTRVALRPRATDPPGRTAQASSREPVRSSPPPGTLITLGALSGLAGAALARLRRLRD